MADEKPVVRRLQLLLHKDYRTDKGRAEARRAAEAAGFFLTGEGHATLSARLSEDQFAEFFKEKSGKGEELAVPEPLKPLISSISEAPDHLPFDQGEQERHEGL